MAYFADGNIESVTDPEGGVTRFAYASAGQLTGITNPNGYARTMEVDAAGQVTAVIDPTGARTSFTYDAGGNQETSTDRSGLVRTLVFDAAGRQTETRDSTGVVRTAAYDAEARVVGVVDARGFRSTTTYDDAGRPIQNAGPDGAVSSIAYCADIAEECGVVDTDGNLTTIEFDAARRNTRVIDPLGRASVTSYDAAGRVQSTSGPLQPPTWYSYYSTNGQLYRVTTPALMVEYGYDGRGNRTTVTAATTQKTSYSYDKANRLLSETNPLGTATVYTYDAAGNRATKLDGNGKVTNYHYDAHGRLREVRFADGTRYEYDYDSRGNRTLERNASHERILEYDGRGRVKRTTDVRLGRTLTYSHDQEGNRLSLAFDGSTHSYAYDSAGRLVRAADAQGKVITFGYDELGRRRWMKRPNGIHTTYAYDQGGQVRDVVHANAHGDVLLSFRYEYDNNGRRVSKTNADGFREVYAYDSDDRLTEVSYGPSSSASYALSSTGNRTYAKEVTSSGAQVTTRHVSSTYNAFNQLLSTGTAGVNTAFAYDSNGNLLSEVTGTKTTRYRWNADNRLVEVDRSNDGVERYQYDANGIRISKESDSDTTAYLLDGGDVTSEYGPDGRITARYLTHPSLADETLAIEMAGTWYPLGDGLSSVIGISDATGSVVRTANYEVYGQRTVTGTGPEVAFGFAGREHDPSGLLYVRDRYLNPRFGRWLQPDRLGIPEVEHSGDRAVASLYAYAFDNPITWTDPTGLSPVTAAFGRFIGGVASDQLLAAGAYTMGIAVLEYAFGERDFARDLFLYGVGLFLTGLAVRALTRACGGAYKMKPDVTLSGGRGGGRVKTLTGPPNSLVNGGPGRIFGTDGSGRVVIDLTLKRIKPVVPGVGFADKIPLRAIDEIVLKIILRMMGA